MKWYQKPLLGSWPMSAFDQIPLPWASIPEGKLIALTWPAADEAAVNERISKSLQHFKDTEFSRYNVRIRWWPRRCIIERLPNEPTAERTKQRFHFRLKHMKVGDKQSRRLPRHDHGEFKTCYATYAKRLESRYWQPPTFSLAFTDKGVTITRTS